MRYSRGRERETQHGLNLLDSFVRFDKIMVII